MPYKVKFQATGVIIHFYGVVTRDDFIASGQEMWGQQNWDKAEYEIADLSEAITVDISEDCAMEIAHLDNAATLSSLRHKVAIIATKPEVIHLAQIYAKSVVNWNWEARTFNDMDSALAWATE
ncbi:hypothetical protein [Kiloniella sp.]|uniref:hypothetical protein n=1 Tax=Kiloniella sp. TaxID=1938587 RepID=UPI003B02D78B